MNTELLRTFLEVAKTRHFGRAAENLYMTQSAVSSRIKQLEETLGVDVFSRERNNILLTPAGERLLPHAENLITSWQLAVQEIGAPKKQNLQLSLGGTFNLWDTFLQSVLPKLVSEFPNLCIRTEINQPQYLIRSLLDGRLDVITVLDAPTNIVIASKIIGQLALVMVCNMANQTLADVPYFGYIFVDWGAAFNLRQARLFIKPVAPILHTGQSHIALEFILNYRGAAYLPRALVEPYLTEGRLFVVSGSVEIHRDVYLVYHKEVDNSTSLGPVIQFLGNLDIKSDSTAF